MTDQQTVTFKATVFWANLTVKNEMSNKYQVELGRLSEKAVAALEAIGIGCGFHEDAEDSKKSKGDFITCKSQNPIRAYDKETGENIAEVGVGNGSQAICVVTPYDWTFKKKSGTSASLARMVITDLVEFDGAEAMEIDLDEAL